MSWVVMGTSTVRATDFFMDLLQEVRLRWSSFWKSVAQKEDLTLSPLGRCVLSLSLNVRDHAMPVVRVAC